MPLMTLKEKLTAGKKTEVNTSVGTNNKKGGCKFLYMYFSCFFCAKFVILIYFQCVTGLDTNESSDNEPPIKVAKGAKKSVDKEDDDSSDDEPLSVLATKLKPKLLKEANVKNSRVRAKVVDSKRTATRKRGKCQSMHLCCE